MVTTPIQDALDGIVVAEMRLKNAIADAREQGQSWAEIGTALGVTRQAAQQRWGEDVARALRMREAVRRDPGYLHRTSEERLALRKQWEAEGNPLVAEAGQ